MAASKNGGKAKGDTAGRLSLRGFPASLIRKIKAKARRDRTTVSAVVEGYVRRGISLDVREEAAARSEETARATA